MSVTQTAAGRVNALLDANSFVEIGAQVTARSTDFNLTAKSAPSDGVLTGYGTVDGSLVYVYCQDAAVLGGSIGEMHAKKIVRIYDLARKMGAPVVAVLDSTGVRIEEAADALNALGEIMNRQIMSSGVVPQITVVLGTCGGGLSFIPALSDFAFMSDGAKLFVHTPDAVEGNSADKKDTSSAAFQAEAGNVDVTGSEEEVIAEVRRLLGFLPCNNEDDGEICDCTDDLNRSTPNLSTLSGDAAQIAAQIADNGDFFELKKEFGKNMVTGFMRLNGQTVGVVANRGVRDTICPNCAKKAARFIKICDAFNIPVLTLANAAAVRNSEKAEYAMPEAAALLTSAYANATVPKVTVVTGRNYGSAYVIMGSKAVGADIVYAWPGAEIGTMDAKQAGKILAAGKDAKSMNEAAKEYAALQQNVLSAAQRGYVDTIIEEADTRKYVIGAFEMLYTKREDRPERKHGTI